MHTKKKHRSFFGVLKKKNKTQATEQMILDGFVTLKEKVVKDIFIPRIDAAFLSIHSSIDQLLEQIEQGEYSRYPVYENTMDNIIGVLYIKDIIFYMARNHVKSLDQIPISDILRPAFVIPETKTLDTLLKDFKNKHIHIAVCVDEYGGISGIVCMEDILELIVGDIQDEFDDEQEEFVSLSNDTFLCLPRLSLQEFNEKLNLDIESPDYDTLGGFVFDLFGKVPSRYEKASYQNLDFIINSVEGSKIQSIKVIRHLKDDHLKYEKDSR